MAEHLCNFILHTKIQIQKKIESTNIVQNHLLPRPLEALSVLSAAQ